MTVIITPKFAFPSSGAHERTPSVPSISQVRSTIEIADEDPNLWDLRDVVRIYNCGVRKVELEFFCPAHDLVPPSRAIVGDSANRSGQRLIPLGPKTLKAFGDLQARHPGQYILGDRPMHILDRVSRQLHAVAGSIGAGPMALYSLRRLYFLRLCHSGISAPIIRYLLGHRQVEWETYLPMTSGELCDLAQSELTQLGEEL